MNEKSLLFGCNIAAYGDVNKAIEYSVLAEQSGFDSITVPDHLFHPLEKGFLELPPWEAFTTLSFIAARTRKARLMPAVADSVRRHPAVIAHMIATLDQLSGGRMILGIGAGEAFNFASIKDVEWSRPYGRLKETIDVVKMLWTSTKDSRVSYKGKFFHLEDTHMGFKPRQKPHPPIYVGGYGPRIRSLVGKSADGWIPWLHEPRAYSEDLKLIHGAAKEAGRRPEEINKALLVLTVVSKSREDARKIGYPRNRIALALRPRLLHDLGYRELAHESIDMIRMTFNRQQVEKLTEVSSLIPQEAVDATSVVGNEEDAIEKIARYEAAGVSHLIVIPLTSRFEETVNAYKDMIIPYFKNQ